MNIKPLYPVYTFPLKCPSLFSILLTFAFYCNPSKIYSNKHLDVISSTLFSSIIIHSILSYSTSLKYPMFFLLSSPSFANSFFLLICFLSSFENPYAAFISFVFLENQSPFLSLFSSPFENNLLFFSYTPSFKIHLSFLFQRPIFSFSYTLSPHSLL